MVAHFSLQPRCTCQVYHRERMHANHCEHVDKQEEEQAKTSHHRCRIYQCPGNCLDLLTVEEQMQALIV